MIDAHLAGLPDLPPLRPYQERGMDDLRRTAAQLRRARPRTQGYGVLAVAPTGAGKTLIGLTLARGAMAKRKRVLWLAARGELIDQPVRKLAEYGLHATPGGGVCVVKAGVRGDLDAPIVVGSIQTLAARNFLPPADVVVFDEARHYVSAEWGRIAMGYRGAVRIGLDATPGRSDGGGLGDLFDELVEISSVAELTELGWLIPSVVYGPESYGSALCDEPVVAWQRWAGRDIDGQQPRTIVFCGSRAESRRQAAAFGAAGIPAEHVDGESSSDHRDGALERLRSGETRVLCNVLLYTEGLDLPELSCVAIARGLSNAMTWIQIGGRALRPAVGGRARPGEIARIIDLRGHFHRNGFGPLDAPRSWSLEGKALRPVEALPACTQCRECHAWGPGGSMCPVCGIERPPPPPPKMSKREMRELAAAERRTNTPQEGPEWDLWCELVHTQREREYRPRYAAMMFQRRTGRWPIWRVEDVPEEQASVGAAS